MKLLKRNIKIAIIVISTMFALFTVFSFVSSCFVQKIMLEIELLLTIEEINAIKTFMTSLSSGVLGSAIVAVVFYVNEYDSEKRKNIYDIIRESGKFQEVYRKIPYQPYKGEYYKIERQYYYEVIENRNIQKLLESLEEELDRIPKEIENETKEAIAEIRRKEKYEYTTKLREILESNPQLRKRRFSEDIISVEQKLEDVVAQYDLYINRMMEIVESLSVLQNKELSLHIEDYSCIFNFSTKIKRKIIEQINFDVEEANSIFPYKENEKVSSDMVCERILKIHTRVFRKFKALLSTIDNINNASERKEVLLNFLKLQDEIYGEAIKKIPMVDSQGKINGEYEINYAYNRLNMCVDNLHNIMFRELNGEYIFQSKEHYVKEGETVEYGGLTRTITIPSEDIGNIYRK